MPVMLFFFAACLVMVTASNWFSPRAIFMGLIISAIAYSGLLAILPGGYRSLMKWLDASFPSGEGEPSQQTQQPSQKTRKKQRRK